eukprot:3944395-Alexandrium_andersonii.AAC.1
MWSQTSSAVAQCLEFVSGQNFNGVRQPGLGTTWLACSERSGVPGSLPEPLSNMLSVEYTGGLRFEIFR